MVAWLAPAAALCALAATGCLSMGGLGAWQRARGEQPAPLRFVSASSASAQQPAGLLDLVAEAVEVEAVEMVRTPSEWEVVYEGGFVSIRKRDSLSSEAVGLVATGTVVLGVEEGRWLKLSVLDGYMQIRLDLDEELLRRRVVSYLMIDGSCGGQNAHDIPDQAICRHAARSLDQAEEAIWFKDGCQVDPARTRVASSLDAHSSSVNSFQEEGDDEEEEEEEERERTTTKEEGEDEQEEEDGDHAAEIAAQTDEEAAKDEPSTGRSLRSGARHRRQRHVTTTEAGHSAHGSSSSRGQSGGDSWEEYSKAFKRICSTAPYEADKLMPVPSVTSVTRTTTSATMKAWGSPSLFCFAVFRANTPEQDLVEEACRLQAGIFACDTAVTVSGEKVLLGKDWKKRDVWSWVSNVDEVAMGDIANNADQTTNSWLNTQIFINALNMLVNNDLMWEHDWTVKADPDAVIFPDRVRTHVTASGATGTAAFYENCLNEGLWKLYGAIEVFSKEAMERYRDAGQQECEWGEDWKGWGEDMYVAVCMRKLGAAAIQSRDLVGDKYCEPKDCSDSGPAAFHFYKTKDDWRWCLEASTGLSFPAAEEEQSES